MTSAVQGILGGEGAALKGVAVNGLEKKDIRLLTAYARNGCPGNFVEVMACEGGCVAGPRGLVQAATSARCVMKE